MRQLNQFLRSLCIFITLFVFACGVSGGVTWDPKPQTTRIVAEIVKDRKGMDVIAEKDTKLDFYCDWSSNQGVDIYPIRCIPFTGDIYFSDNTCTTPVVGLPSNQDINPYVKYVRNHGHFYQFGAATFLKPDLLLWTKNRDGVCQMFFNGPNSQVWRVCLEVNPIIFATEDE